MSMTRAHLGLFGLKHKPVIIAEIGASHGGSLDVARALVGVCKHAGADVVKVQMGLDELTAPTSGQHDVFKAIELTRAEHDLVRAEAKDRGLPWSASCWSESAARYLGETDAPFIKIGSGDITAPNAIRWSAKSGKPAVISTGMATIDEIREALELWGAAGGVPQIVLLACTVSYPAATVDSHVARMEELKRRFVGHYGVIGVGYSSHCADWRVPAYAARMGADVIEVHVASTPHDDGSIGAMDLSEMVSVIRGHCAQPWDALFEKMAWGKPDLGVMGCESRWLEVARRDPKSGVRV